MREGLVPIARIRTQSGFFFNLKIGISTWEKGPSEGSIFFPLARRAPEVNHFEEQVGRIPLSTVSIPFSFVKENVKKKKKRSMAVCSFTL